MVLIWCSVIEVVEYGVWINVVLFSIVWYKFLDKIVLVELLDWLVVGEVFGWVVEFWEVVVIIVFLVSDYLSYLIGEVILVFC